jgi:hypothetical protein
MDPMKCNKQEEIILHKYTSIINDILDHQFEMASVRAAMLWQYSGGKKQLTGATLWRKMEKVMTDMRLFASKFPGVNSTSLQSAQWVDSALSNEAAVYYFALD